MCHRLSKRNGDSIEFFSLVGWRQTLTAVGFVRSVGAVIFSVADVLLRDAAARRLALEIFPAVMSVAVLFV